MANLLLSLVTLLKYCAPSINSEDLSVLDPSLKRKLGCLQIICKNFFAILVQSVSLCHRLFKKLNLITESWSKQRFSLSLEKAVIQAVCLRTQAVSIKARF